MPRVASANASDDLMVGCDPPMKLTSPSSQFHLKLEEAVCVFDYSRLKVDRTVSQLLLILLCVLIRLKDCPSPLEVFTHTTFWAPAETCALG